MVWASWQACLDSAWNKLQCPLIPWCFWRLCCYLAAGYIFLSRGASGCSCLYLIYSRKWFTGNQSFSHSKNCCLFTSIISAMIRALGTLVGKISKVFCASHKSLYSVTHKGCSQRAAPVCTSWRTGIDSICIQPHFRDLKFTFLCSLQQRRAGSRFGFPLLVMSLLGIWVSHKIRRSERVWVL